MVATTLGTSTPATTAEAQPGMSRRDELAFMFFSVWIVAGLFLDGWSHNSDKPETFFTPWHGLLYSGFAASMLWGARERYLRRNDPPAEVLAGERQAAIGGVLFAIGGVTDMVWHQVFGIEVGIEGLLSPTHLLLMIGGLLAASAPMRTIGMRRGEGLWDWAPMIVGTAVVTSLVGFFTQLLSAFHMPGWIFTIDDTVGQEGQLRLAWGIGSLLVTAVLFTIAVLAVRARATTPVGFFAIALGLVALAMTGLASFEHAPLIAPAIAAGYAADRLIASRAHALVVGAAVPAVLLAGWAVVTAAVWGLSWPAEIASGTVVLGALFGAGAALVAGDGRTIEA